MTSFNLATKTARERTEVELDKAASLAIYKLPETSGKRRLFRSVMDSFLSETQTACV